MKKKSGSSFVFLLIVSILVFYLSNRLAALFQSLEGTALEKMLETTEVIFKDISTNPFFISTNQNDLIAGSVGFAITLLIYLYGLTGRKNFLVGMEHGSAKWGDAGDIAPFADKIYEQNMLFSGTEKMSLNTRKTLRNNNVVIIGGSGSGKTRFYVKPNLMQLHTSFVVTDPKGSLLLETGKMLASAGYKIKVLDLINMEKSDRYNFFEYLKDEKDILKLVTNLITNTNPKDSKNGGDFWEKAETALLQALIAYVFFEALPEEKNIGTIMELLRLAEVKEDDEDFDSPLDILFQDLKDVDPNHFACKQYDLYKLAAGKTAKSILVSVGVRLSPFNITVVADLLSEDSIGIDSLGDEKTALFVIIPDTDKTFNFIAAMMYQQLFDILFYKADNLYGGRLPYHVRFMLDEFANIGQIPNFETYIATMRSREVSVNVVLQNVAQLKSLYKDTWETITGNCDTLVFLGGKEQSTLEYMSKMIGKTTIDLRTTNESKGQSGSYSINNQVLGRELITPAEVGLLKGDECIVSIRGANPFRSKKFDITKHKRYKELSDYNPDNTYRFTGDSSRKSEYFFSNIQEIQYINSNQ